MDITETPEYSSGWEWAVEHGPLLSELFTGRDVSTPELRTRLFREAGRRWPSGSDNLVNDLKQTAFVAGAIKAAVQTLRMSPEAQAAIFEAALEMGVIWSSEQGKAKALQMLQDKPAGWWRRKMGAATPNDVVNALSVAWRHDWSKERGRRHPRSKWEVMIDTMGPRELWILAEATQILIREDGLPRYVVDAPEEAFEVVSRPVYEDGVMRRYPGEIVG
jgi:hypothetical protein